MKKPTFELEDLYVHPYVFGVDEAGRGPLAGPVVAACVYIPQQNRNHPVWKDVNDSKILTETRREILFSVIQSQCISGIGSASVEDIDSINILQASFLAMRRALESCEPAPDMVLIDGNRAPKDWPWASRPIIKGDSKSVSIAAASILAKVTRDRIMKDLAQEFPAYDWDKNAGYGTPAHLEAIYRSGISPHHRKSFAPVKNLEIRKVG